MTEKKYTVCFTGDVSFSGYFEGREKDSSLLDEKIREFIAAADSCVVNLESPVTESSVSRKERLSHRCGKEAVEFISDTFSDPVISFANNHIMDYGIKGLEDSLEAAEESGIKYIGAGRNLEEASGYVVLGEDIKVAVMAVQYKNELAASGNSPGPLHEFEEKRIKQTVKQMKQDADYAVMVYHGGNEFLHVPMPYIRKTLKKYLRWGCDAVVAHHPHVVQGYEVTGKKSIYYSLGNFIFDTRYQRAQEGTDRGVLLNLTFSEDGISRDVLPFRIDRDTCCLAAEAEDSWFADIKGENYTKAWCSEALRKKDVRKRADRLKESGKDMVDDEVERIEINRSGRDRRRAFHRKLVMKTGQFIASKFIR